MKSMKMGSLLSSVLVSLLLVSVACFAAEKRTALVIGNGDYRSAPLANPVNDADGMAYTLRNLGFEVMVKKNARQQEMEDALREFGDRLKKGGVGLFFYAGHGVQVAGKNYLLPIDARITRETEVKYKAVDVDMILDEMGGAGNAMNIVILDACRDNPFGRSFRSAGRGLAIVSAAPRGTYISYSTSPGKVAADGAGGNSPYTAALIKHMTTPGLPIEEVFKRVRQDIGSETKGQQIPWELSSLEGQFYFAGREERPAATAGPDADMVRQQDILDREKQDLARREKELEKQRAIAAQREQLAEKRRLLEEERQKLAADSLASASGPREIRRDGRFVAYNDDTVLDTRTNLMWAARDNGESINWDDAKRYCESYRGGGYSDWRLPTQDELAGLLDRRKSRLVDCHATYPVHVATELIAMTCFAPWATRSGGSESAYVGFMDASHLWYGLFGGDTHRALPVRTHTDLKRK